MLPSSIDEDGRASERQHLLTMIIDDRVAVDAGCLAFSCTDLHRSQVRDVVLTHTHLDHIAGLPMFIDDLFASTDEAVRIHATPEMIDILEHSVFNWKVYPRFSELSNSKGKVLEYHPFDRGGGFEAAHLSFRSVPVNHQVSACGYLVSDGAVEVGITGDTAQTEEFWALCADRPNLQGVFVECAFPNELADLAGVSCHLTPALLKRELEKFKNETCPVYVISIKPMYRERVIGELIEAGIPRLQIMEIGRTYEI